MMMMTRMTSVPCRGPSGLEMQLSGPLYISGPDAENRITRKEKHKKAFSCLPLSVCVYFFNFSVLSHPQMPSCINICCPLSSFVLPFSPVPLLFSFTFSIEFSTENSQIFPKQIINCECSGKLYDECEVMPSNGVAACFILC